MNLSMNNGNNALSNSQGACIDTCPGLISAGGSGVLQRLTAVQTFPSEA